MADKGPAPDMAPEWIASPEFRAAVQAAALQIAAQIAPARADGGDSDILGRLALNIAELTDQGSGRKRIDPNIVVARRAAKQQMLDLLVDLRARGEVPHWRLKNKVQLVIAEGETVLDPVTVGSDHLPVPVEVAHYAAPNLAMEPINDAARRVFALYCESRGSVPSQGRLGWTITRGGVVLQDAVTPDGEVIQSRATAAILNRDARRNGDGPPVAAGSSDQALPHLAAVIRRNGHSNEVQTRVLGTLAEPARQTA